MFIYYVYAYLRKNGNPYYIGKGKGNRAYQSHRWHNPPKDRSRIVIMESNLSEIGALALERRYILWYGRKDNSTGILINKTDGGDGSIGAVASEETRQKMSATRVGKKHSTAHCTALSVANKGKPGHPRSIETRLKMSIAGRGKAKPQVRCPHCGQTGSAGNMHVWHFDNCKKKLEIDVVS